MFNKRFLKRYELLFHIIDYAVSNKLLLPALNGDTNHNQKSTMAKEYRSGFDVSIGSFHLM